MPNKKKPSGDVRLIQHYPPTRERVFSYLHESSAQRKIPRNLKIEQDRETRKFNHALSGDILSLCEYVPLEDLAARWKISPGMLRESAGNGLFDIIVTEHANIRDHWYLNSKRWPHGEKLWISPTRGVVHTLVNAPLRLSSSVQCYFPVEEVSRVEQVHGLIPSVSAPPVEPWVTVKEAAIHYDRTPKTIDNWRKAKPPKIPSQKMPGGGIRVQLKKIN